MTKEEAAAYLAAFIDGEGHISCTATARGHFTKNIAFCNTDKQLFDRVIELAAMLGLEFRTYHRVSPRKGWSPCWLAYIKGGRPSFERFAALVPLQCEKKKQKLADLVASYVDMEIIYAKQRTRIRRKCLICDKEFFTLPSKIKRNRGKYCSRRCVDKGRRQQKARKCTQCGCLYYIKPSRARKTRFCSHTCAGTFYADRGWSATTHHPDVIR
jgi:hypothetical protein